MPEVGNPVQACPLKKEEEKQQEATQHFIKFKLQDDKGKPMPNVRIKLTLPDASIEERISDEKGFIEIKNIPPGTCKLESDWKECNVKRTVFIQ